MAHFRISLSPAVSMVSPAFPRELGRLRQAAFRRPRTCSPLSGPLHPSRRHLQPSTRCLRERSCLLPLERLCPRQQAEVMTVSADEFLRRFLLHVLPKVWSASATSDFFANRRREMPLHAAASCSARCCARSPETTNLYVVPHAPAPCWSSNGSPAPTLLPARPDLA